MALSWGAAPSALTTGIGPRLEVEARSHSRNVKWTISFRLTADGSYLESGTILMHSEYWPTKRISQGEAAFVKYCLRKSREITSVDNRLGCYEPALKYVRTTVRWAHHPGVGPCASALIGTSGQSVPRRSGSPRSR